jgi:hypothetical protein
MHCLQSLYLNVKSKLKKSFFSEINRTRNELFHGMTNGVESPDSMTLPSPAGPRIKLSEKVFAPVKEYPKVLLMHWLHNSSPRARNSGLPMVKLQAKFY